MGNRVPAALQLAKKSIFGERQAGPSCLKEGMSMEVGEGGREQMPECPDCQVEACGLHL